MLLLIVELNTETTEAMPNPRTIVSGLAPYMPIEALLVNIYCTTIAEKKIRN